VLEDVKRVAEITSHADRARAASELLTELQASVTEAARLRRESIAWLREHGYSLAAIADIIGVSRARIAQLREAGPPPERAFLGTDRLTVAIPLKTEAASGRPVVAQEDFAAFNLLADLARDLQLEATAEYIPLGGELDLNRDNLIVICGPRLSPVVGEVLQTDPVLGFDQDDAGRWLLQDRRTGQRYPSPSDLPQPRPADVGYLSRLSRPDGNGTFILLTGVHAVGSHGVIDFLRRELADLYEQVDLQPFSTLIATEYDPGTRQLVRSERIAPLYRHQES
jgi:transcriptional regulator with XRE-family HTH domain